MIKMSCRLLKAVIGMLLVIFFLGSCEKFFNPDQELVIEKDEFFQDWSEFRSAEMGLYAMQQELVDQIIILGELRADLMEITPNADRDLRDVYNFQISRDNKFASPINFYKLIGACNSLINQLESTYPQIQEKEESSPFRMYGEVKCMRAWAYFYAVRIYGKVPFIWPSLTTAEEITAYVNSGSSYIDSVQIAYDPGGYYNDTITDTLIVLKKQFMDQNMVVDAFTEELEKDVDPNNVGVIHNKVNLDLSWDITIWTKYAYYSLLGQMYLFRGDHVKALEHFNHILYNRDSETSNIKYGLDDRFSYSRWRNIFSGLDGLEHIYTLWFGKSYQQQHNLQTFFSNVAPNQYMIKPTKLAIDKWETMWEGMRYNRNTNPSLTTLERRGTPGDFYRGYGISFVYKRGEEIMEPELVRDMLLLKLEERMQDVRDMMDGVDTVLYKFTYGKQPYDQDANIIFYRAASIHLYCAEIYSRWEWDHEGIIKPDINTALRIVNNGSYDSNTKQLGVRGRVGFGGELGAGIQEDDGIQVANIIYKHDPYTNNIVGYQTFPDLLSKQEYLEDQIIEERARELAFEGERFYDLMRIAKRRNDPSYLADKVSQKFSGPRREEIREWLMNEENWYLHYFD